MTTKRRIAKPDDTVPSFKDGREFDALSAVRPHNKLSSHIECRSRGSFTPSSRQRGWAFPWSETPATTIPSQH